MNSSNTLFCPIHPSEPISRVSKDPYSSKMLYCVECIVSIDQQNLPTLITLKEAQDIIQNLINLASKVEKQHAKNLPKELWTILENKDSLFSKVQSHFSSQRKKALEVIEKIEYSFRNAICNIKNSINESLDKQLQIYETFMKNFELKTQLCFPSTQRIAKESPLLSQLVSSQSSELNFHDESVKLRQSFVLIENLEKFTKIEDQVQDLNSYSQILQYEKLPTLKLLEKVHEDHIQDIEKYFSTLEAQCQHVQNYFKSPVNNQFLKEAEIEKIREVIQCSQGQNFKLVHEFSKQIDPRKDFDNLIDLLEEKQNKGVLIIATTDQKTLVAFQKKYQGTFFEKANPQTEIQFKGTLTEHSQRGLIIIDQNSNFLIGENNTYLPELMKDAGLKQEWVDKVIKEPRCCLFMDFLAYPQQKQVQVLDHISLYELE